MEKNENDVCIQVTCKFSYDNRQLYGCMDLINDNAKLENFNNQFAYGENDSGDKIFRQVFEEQNLPKLFIQGHDLTIVKYGKRDVFYENQGGASNDQTLTSSTSSSSASSASSRSFDNEDDNDEDDDDSSSEHSGDMGIVHTFIRSIFEELVSCKDVHTEFSIGWTEINEHNQLLDLLLDHGLVKCNTITKLYDTIAIGLKNRNVSSNHNILSIVLEQQLQMNQTVSKLSTINFCDLNYGTEKAFTNQFIGGGDPRDMPMNFYSQPMLPQYYPLPPPPPVSHHNFNSFNSFQFSPPVINYDAFFNGNFRPPPPPPLPAAMAATFDPNHVMMSQQNQRLLKNAELLFSKLNLNDMEEEQRKEIQEWIYLKTECDSYTAPATMELPPSYFSNNAHLFASQIPPSSISPTVAQQVSNINAHQQSALLPIMEMDETNDDRKTDELNENDDDSESGSYIDINDQSNNLLEKITDKMTNFQERTDEIVRNKCGEYFDNNPKVVLSSSNSGQSDSKPTVENTNLEPAAMACAGSSSNVAKLCATNTSTSEQYLAKTGRRRSIRDNNILKSDELNLIKKAAAATSIESDSVKEDGDTEQLSKLDELRKSLKKSMASIDATNLQIKEVEQTIALKKNLITDFIENNKTRMTAKHKCSKKKSKYQSEYEKCKKDISKAIMAGKNPLEIQRLKEMAAKFEEKLLDLNSINEIAAESSSNKKVKQLHKSLEQSKKQLEVLNKVLKKEVKHRDAIEREVEKQMKLIEEANDTDSQKKLKAGSPSPPSSNSKLSDSKVKIRDVNARISHLDEILKEKSSNLQLCKLPGDDKEKESLRYEIRNLRRTRDTLLDQRVSLYKKLKRDKILTYKEERKMLECDEAIEAIDDVIEVKNELICGHKSIDTDERLEREKGEQLLMARLNKLSEEEMRILLYKYFMKVIDLKESCRKLEQNLMSFERDKEAWEWREKILTNAIRQTRLESERNLIIQQKNHETRLNLLLRHFANETTTSSLNESTNFESSSTTGTPHLPDYEELNIVKATKSASSRHQYHQQHHAQIHQAQEIDRDFKKNLFTKFHIFTRYHQQQGSSSANNALAVANRESAIPQENLKQLNEKTKPATKVTRQKNKLIIQQNDNS